MKQDFQVLQIIHIALCAGVFLFAAVTMLLIGQSGNFSFDSMNENVFALLAIGFGAVASFVSGMLATQFWGKINKRVDENSVKFAGYRTGSIIQWAMIEGAALFSIVSFLLYSNYFFLILGLALLLVLFSRRPTSSHLKQVTGIDERDMK